MAITVSIVEDDRETRESLGELLNGAPGLRCLRNYPTGEAALLGIPAEKPNVVLVDINLPGISGIECVSKLKGQLPQLQVLMITTYEDGDLIFRSLRAGASGYLLKKTPHAKLIEAIKEVHSGGAPMSMQIARKVVQHFHQIQQPVFNVDKLTKREQEILALLAKGRRYKEIMDDLGLSLSTVRTHLAHIYGKLHVQSRTEAAVKFLGREPA
ncbi:MAG: response regulator transcription factor [Verrucomicrobia bacterium]|nr:response regulator transcription factor [Verrucomicrobiota bacterium]MDE3100238.1 response regulator transcription factor [Verrucomicrobiota bacterium]